jgi:hypothetical protein
MAALDLALSPQKGRVSRKETSSQLPVPGSQLSAQEESGLGSNARSKLRSRSGPGCLDSDPLNNEGGKNNDQDSRHDPHSRSLNGVVELFIVRTRRQQLQRPVEQAVKVFQKPLDRSKVGDNIAVAVSAEQTGYARLKLFTDGCHDDHCNDGSIGSAGDQGTGDVVAGPDAKGDQPNIGENPQHSQKGRLQRLGQAGNGTADAD